MDAVRFLQERKRMCAERPCVACPVYATGQGCTEDDNPELVCATVEEWSAAHPRKTRQSVFLKQWPEAKLENGVLKICPFKLTNARPAACPTLIPYECGTGAAQVQCMKCASDFWMQEVE